MKAEAAKGKRTKGLFFKKTVQHSCFRRLRFGQLHFPGCKIESKCYMYFLFYQDLFLLVFVGEL